MKIDEVRLKVIPDSRGEDTLEGILKSGAIETSGKTPSGKSTGKTEAAVVLPQKALEKAAWLNSQIKDRNFSALEEFDHFLISLDGTENKQNLGANVILALSLAFTRLLAKSENIELYQVISKISGNQPKLPLCFFNLIEGGVHAENSLPFQEYLLIPQTNSPKQSLETVMSSINLLKEKIQKEYSQISYGDEGGFVVPSDDPLQGLRLLQNFEGKLGLDVAASTMQQKQLTQTYENIARDFPVLSIEDPFDEAAWDDFAKLTARIGNKVWIIGDDLLTTNVGRIKKAYEKQAVNGVLIKPNQIGSVSETIQAVNLAKSYGWKIIVSHRSGETMDDFIADLAVGTGADGLKSGCPLQKERLVKYERLKEIERWLT